MQVSERRVLWLRPRWHVFFNEECTSARVQYRVKGTWYEADVNCVRGFWEHSANKGLPINDRILIALTDARKEVSRLRHASQEAAVIKKLGSQRPTTRCLPVARVVSE